MAKGGFYIPVPSKSQCKSIIKAWAYFKSFQCRAFSVGLLLQFYNRSQIKYAVTTVFIFVL